jgi:hypothetical protein
MAGACRDAEAAAAAPACRGAEALWPELAGTQRRELQGRARGARRGRRREFARSRRRELPRARRQELAGALRRELQGRAWQSAVRGGENSGRLKLRVLIGVCSALELTPKICRFG